MVGQFRNGWPDDAGIIFNQANINDQCVEYDDGARLNDFKAAALIESVANVIIPKEIQTYEKQKRDEVIGLL